MTRGERRVLVADDSMVVRALLRTQLLERGYTVKEAADGEQALDGARDFLPDVILLDIDMPRLNGFEVLGHLKEDESLREVPVVFITGRTTADDVVKGLDLGAHDYLRKPFEAAELAARVHAAMRIKHLQDDLRKVNTELSRQAMTDGLTGLANRRALDDALERACSRSARHATNLCLMLVDVDHFKRINDDHGHQAGDEALVSLGDRLRERLRTEDLLGRWGGEEFMIIAPDTEAEGAAVLAEALRTCMETNPLMVRREEVPVTVSVGWTAWNGDSPEDLVRRADKRLYAAKDAGRNRVEGDPL
jgi:diguanylate cyclase (GGDEF)-like protein